MKKLLIRILGSIFILAALFVMFIPTWIQIDGISRRDMRDMRAEMLADVSRAEEVVLRYIGNDDYKESLQDCDLPSTKSAVKKRIKETETLLKETVNEDISLQELLNLSLKLPGYITDCENLTEFPYLPQIIEDTAEFEDTIDSLSDIKMVFYVIGAAFIILILLGVASAITHSLHHARFVKYIFLALLVIVVLGFTVGASLLSDFMIDTFEMPEQAEDMTAQVTVMPYVALILAFVPVILDIIFERNLEGRNKSGF